MKGETLTITKSKLITFSRKTKLIEKMKKGGLFSLHENYGCVVKDAVFADKSF